jgi:hypothetical protein
LNSCVTTAFHRAIAAVTAWWLGLFLVCAAAIGLISGLARRREMRAFIGSNLLLAGLLATGACRRRRRGML